MEEYNLLKSVARSEGLNAQFEKKKGYLPLFKHPLPVSENRYTHEDILRKVVSCKLGEITLLLLLFFYY